MKSNELFQEFFKRHGVKRLAAKLGLACSYLYKWTHPDGGKAAGGLNPLERLLALIQLTGDLLPLHWLNEKCGGFFTKNPVPKVFAADQKAAVVETTEAVADYLKLAADMTQNGGLTPEKVARLRARWEQLKSTGEGFVVACERGVFRCGAFFLSLGWWFTSGEVLVMEAV